MKGIMEIAREGIMENGLWNVLWDFSVQADHHLAHNRPDIVVLEKEEITCSVIDVACPLTHVCLKRSRENPKISRPQKFVWEDLEL